ncbi:hypothetical protein NM463_000167 [Citrobacter koseri]|nr:hypothetical protein [Citrobacter koseri]
MHKNVMASMLGVVLFGALSNISWAAGQDNDLDKTVTKRELYNQLATLAQTVSQKGDVSKEELIKYIDSHVKATNDSTREYIKSTDKSTREYVDNAISARDILQSVYTDVLAEHIDAQNRSLSSQQDAINTVKQDVTVSVGKVNKELDEKRMFCAAKSARPKLMQLHRLTIMQKPCVASLSSRVIPCAAKSAVSKGMLTRV